MRLAFDTGGTFTDMALVDDRGRLHLRKVLSTPHDPGEAVLTGVRLLLGDAGVADPSAVGVYGATTTVTNAVIERKGARTALIATRGFRDMLRIRDEGRYDVYDILIDMPEPLVSRGLCLEVDGRVAADGTEIQAPDAAQVRALAALLREHEVESVAVCLLHAYAHPTHEQAVSTVLAEAAPEIMQSLSSVVSPQINEYLRASTVVVNAYAAPVLRRQIARLLEGLEALGLPRSLSMMASSGGLVTARQAAAMPVRMIESGPAAGALAAAEVGALLGYGDLLSFDMGGTTAKLAFVKDGVPTVAPELEVARHSRFQKGSGLPLRISSVEMLEIGAGGGSIARVDSIGLLQVGPQSAASAPGPCCYGLGGSEPTVTDADVLLGYIGTGSFRVRDRPLDAEAAAHAIDRLAGRLGVERMAAARGIHEVVNEDMSKAALAHAAELGLDVRDHTMIAFGGAGPVHAYGIARRLGVRRIIYPPSAGVMSALGLLGAPALVDLSLSWPIRLREWRPADIAALFARLEAQAQGELAEAGIDPATVTRIRSVDLRLVGQGHEVGVRLPGHAPDDARFLPELLAAFDARYAALYGRSIEGGEVEAVTWRLRAAGPRPAQTGMAVALARQAPAADRAAQRRPVHFAELGGFVETPVYRQRAMRPGEAIVGPAIVEQDESTVLLGPGSRARLTPENCLVAELNA